MPPGPGVAEYPVRKPGRLGLICCLFGATSLLCHQFIVLVLPLNHHLNSLPGYRVKFGDLVVDG